MHITENPASGLTNKMYDGMVYELHTYMKIVEVANGLKLYNNILFYSIQ